MDKFLLELNELEMDILLSSLSARLFDMYELQEGEVIDGTHEVKQLEILHDRLQKHKPVGKTNILAT